MSAGPLAGVRVLEIGQLLAGPFVGTVLGYFGADVIKVEPPGGDPIRTWRATLDGTSLWWRAIARNKRVVTIDLRAPEGRDLVRRLAERADVLIENFRPGTMETWSLGPDQIANDRLVYVRVSGFGQSGPRARMPGYASIAEAVAGLRSVIGFADRPPARVNLSLGDTLGGLFGAIGALLALYERDRAGGSGRGQVVDVALTEAIVSVLESMLPEAAMGIVRGPAGTTLSGVAPTNTHRSRDGQWVVVAANNESNFRRLMRAIGRDDLAADDSLTGNEARVARGAELDTAITAWVAARDAAEVVRTLEAAEVPVGLVANAADLLGDPQLRARAFLRDHAIGERRLPFSELAPLLSRTPGQTTWLGPDPGTSTDEVLAAIATPEELAALRAKGAIE